MPKKGRSQNLINKRNEALIRRYYYWTEVRRLRFDDTLKVLANEEFFLSEERIMQIIRLETSRLEELGTQPVPRIRMPRITLRQLELFRK